MDTSDELKTLKEQYGILNARLEAQEIVNERLIRSSVNANVRGLNRDGRVMSLVAVAGIAFSLLDKYLLQWSWTFTLFTIVFMAIALAVNAYTLHGINSYKALNTDLIDLRLRTLRLRRWQSRWLWFSIPWLVVWLVWFVDESMHGTENVYAMIAGMVAGCTIGLVLGVKMYLRTRRQAMDIVSDIESLRAGE